MVSLTALVMVSSMVVGQAEAKTAMPAELQQQIEKCLIGDWIYEGTFGDQKINGEEFWKWANDKSCVIIEGVVVMNGQKVPYTSLAGWEANKKALIVTGFFSGGDTGTTCWTEFSPGEWKGRISGTYQGQAYEAPAKIEFLKDSNRYEDTTAGKPWVTVGKRCASGEQEAGEKAFKAYADLAVGGTWVATVDGKQFEDTYELILGGKLMLCTSKGGGEFPAAVTVAGIDPITKKFTFWGFDAQGGVSVGTSRLVSDGVWLGEWRGNQPNGSASEATRLTKIDADTVKYETLDQTVTGEAKAFPEVTTWKRKR